MSPKGKKGRSKKKKGGRKKSKKAAVEEVVEETRSPEPDAPASDLDEEVVDLDAALEETLEAMDDAEEDLDALIAQVTGAAVDMAEAAEGDGIDTDPVEGDPVDAEAEPELEEAAAEAEPEDEVEVFDLDAVARAPAVSELSTEEGEEADDVEVFDLDAEIPAVVEEDEPEVFDLDEEPAAEAEIDDDEPEVFDLDAEPDPSDATDEQDTDDVEEVVAEEVEDEAPEDAAYDPEAPEAELTEAELDGEEAEEGVPQSTPEARDRIVAAALAHAEMQEARYRVRSESRAVARWKGTLALALFALAGLIAVVPPSLVRPDPPPVVTEVELLTGLRATLLLQAEQVEAFRARNQTLPRSLDEVAVRVPGVRFVRSSNSLYQLVAYTPSGESVVYDSQRPTPEFDGLDGSWTGGGR